MLEELISNDSLREELRKYLFRNQEDSISKDSPSQLKKVFRWARGKDPEDPDNKELLKYETLNLDIVMLYIWSPYMNEYILLEESGIEIKELIYGPIQTNRFIYRIVNPEDNEALEHTGPRKTIYEPVYIDNAEENPLTKNSDFGGREEVKSIAAFIDHGSGKRPEYILILNYTGKRHRDFSYEYKKKLKIFSDFIGAFYYYHIKQKEDEHVRLLESLFDLNRLIPQAAGVVDATESLDKILDSARELCGIEKETGLCSLYVVRKGLDEEKFLEIVACHNPKKESGLGSIIRMDDITKNPEGKKGIVGLVEETKTPFLSPRIFSKSRYYRSHYIEFDGDTESEITIPIKKSYNDNDTEVNTEVIGILNLESPVPGKFKPHHVRYLMHFAPHIAVLLQRILPVDENKDLRSKLEAFGRARLALEHWSIQQRQEEKETMFQNIATECMNAVNAHACMIVTIKNKNKAVKFDVLAVSAKDSGIQQELRARHITPEGMTNKIYERGRGEFISDVHTWNSRELSPTVTMDLQRYGLYSVAAVPVGSLDPTTQKKSSCGVLYIKYFKENHIFSQSDQAILELFANFLVDPIRRYHFGEGSGR